MCKNIIQYVRKTVSDFQSELGLLVQHKNKMRTVLFWDAVSSGNFLLTFRDNLL
jgi:hypothetical protein